MWELWGVEISPLPLKRHIAYTTACCYRTSRETELNCAAFVYVSDAIVSSARYDAAGCCVVWTSSFVVAVATHH